MGPCESAGIGVKLEAIILKELSDQILQILSFFKFVEGLVIRIVWLAHAFKNGIYRNTKSDISSGHWVLSMR